MFADAPHLLKLVRNWLIDTGFVLEDGSKIMKIPLENLVKLTDSEVNICFKMNEYNLTCENTARQNVRRAAELLSHTTATALIHYEVENKIEARALSEFIEAVNTWFDIFNSYIPINKIPTKSAYGNNIEEQKQILNDIKTKMFIIRAMVRSGCGVYDHPSPLDALSRVRMIILGKNPGILESHTCTEDQQQDEYMVAQLFHRANVSINSSSTINDNSENGCSSSSSMSQEQINPATVIDNGPETTGDALEYLGDHIYKYSTEHDYSLPTWVQHLSYGGLIKPNESWKSSIEKFNVEFKKFHQQDLGHGLRKGKRVTKELIRRLCQKHNDIPKEVIQPFVKLRTIIRMKYTDFKPQSRRRKSNGTDDEKRSRLKKTEKIIN
ncbi:hypothetical protein JTB14_020672 [Gonioctena quinquepunctata]|nr:hypothetical protein JTB14_020672 [Gonioctena quinquepunctata]